MANMRSAFSLFCILRLLQIILLTMIVAARALDLPSTDFLKDVVSTIVAKERWDREAKVRISKLETRSVGTGTSQKYEFYIRAAKKVWGFKFSDDVASWKKLKKGVKGFGPDSFGSSGDKRDVVKPFELEGPLELNAVGDYDLTLLLPSNTSHNGLRKIVIGEGIKIKLEAAEEVLLTLPSNSGFPINRSSVMAKKHGDQLWLQKHYECPPLLAVYVQGSASVTACRIHDIRDSIGVVFHSHDYLELLPENYDDSDHFRFYSLFSIRSFSSRLYLLEKILRNFLGNKVSEDGFPQLVKAKIASSMLVKFKLELERDISADDKIWKKIARWKTRPLVERSMFEVVARVEESGVLKPVTFKKLKKPFATMDTTSWSNLMSNISFTKFPSVVAPHEPLTLDVKW